MASWCRITVVIQCSSACCFLSPNPLPLQSSDKHAHHSTSPSAWLSFSLPSWTWLHQPTNRGTRPASFP